jgi:hypothetical protein
MSYLSYAGDLPEGPLNSFLVIAAEGGEERPQIRCGCHTIMDIFVNNGWNSSNRIQL